MRQTLTDVEKWSYSTLCLWRCVGPSQNLPKSIASKTFTARGNGLTSLRSHGSCRFSQLLPCRCFHFRELSEWAAASRPRCSLEERLLRRPWWHHRHPGHIFRTADKQMVFKSPMPCGSSYVRPSNSLNHTQTHRHEEIRGSSNIWFSCHNH